jgi:hypothetical protein
MERRNEILAILYLAKNTDGDKEKFYIKSLLEYIEDDILKQITQLEREIVTLNNDLETLQYVKNELKEK